MSVATPDPDAVILRTRIEDLMELRDSDSGSKVWTVAHDMELARLQSRFVERFGGSI